MTIKDIARMCGVSVSTVSRVLNGHPGVSDAIRERVLAVVEKLHYIPNNSARDLVRLNSQSIGVISRGVGNLFFSSMLKTISQEINNNGMTMVLRQIPTNGNELQAGAELEREKRLRGLLFLGGRFDYEPKELEVLEIPFVCCSYTNSFGSLPADASASVYINDQRAASDAVNHLISRGHRRIAALVPACQDRSVSELRYNGYRSALAERDIPFDPSLVVEIGGYEMEDGYRGVETLLDRGVEFTALFAVSDTLAFAANKALSDRGLHVPEDVSIIGIDGLRLSAYMIPTLTTMVQPAETMGREAVSILMDMIHGGPPRHVRVTATMRSGESVRQI